MTAPCIITVAITGSVPRKEHKPAVPITIGEQVESTHAASAAAAFHAQIAASIIGARLNRFVTV